MRIVALALSLTGLSLLVAPPASAQPSTNRLPTETLDVTPPSERVRGSPGEMAVQALECRSLPLEGARRRIVDIAVQEWGFFGFPILDRDRGMRLLPPGASPRPDYLAFERSSGGRPPSLNVEESARVAASIAGYWAVTPEGGRIVAEQNQAWNGPRGLGVRWRSPWSAAFISWVMCEAGLGTREVFQRAIAHRTYIDQAIRARDGNAPQAAFVAHDIGETTVDVGDMLCSSRRPEYRSIAERRRQMGVGARSHCDVVVGLDATRGRILVIGGNVLRSVSLKILPAAPDSDGALQPLIEGRRPLFAHLKLQANPIEGNAFVRSPTFLRLACSNGARTPDRMTFVVSLLQVRNAARSYC